MRPPCGASIERDFKHPSMSRGVYSTRRWGFGWPSRARKAHEPFTGLSRNKPRWSRGPSANLSGENSYQWVQTMWQLAKVLDNPQVVEDMSVVAWEHLQTLRSRRDRCEFGHFYTNSYEKAAAAN